MICTLTRKTLRAKALLSRQKIRTSKSVYAFAVIGGMLCTPTLLSAQWKHDQPTEEKIEFDTQDKYKAPGVAAAMTGGLLGTSCLSYTGLVGGQAIDAACMKDTKTTENTREQSSNMSRFLRGGVSLTVAVANGVRQMAGMKSAVEQIVEENKKFARGIDRDNAEMTVYRVADASDASADRADEMRDATLEVDNSEVDPHYAIVEQVQERARLVGVDADRMAAATSEAIQANMQALAYVTDSLGRRATARAMKVVTLNTFGDTLKTPTPCPSPPLDRGVVPMNWCQQVLSLLPNLESLAIPAMPPSRATPSAPQSSAFAFAGSLQRSATVARTPASIQGIPRRSEPASAGLNCPASDGDNNQGDPMVLYSRSVLQTKGARMNAANATADAALSRTELGLIRSTEKERLQATDRVNSIRALRAF